MNYMQAKRLARLENRIYRLDVGEAKKVRLRSYVRFAVPKGYEPDLNSLVKLSRGEIQKRKFDLK